jgi:transcriptional regulator with XRE-family HTH domain
MELNEIVKTLMEERDIGNKELAIKSGVPLRTINNIVSGITANPTLETMRAIAKALNCTLDDFTDDNPSYQTEGTPDDLTPYLDELRHRPEMRMLFSVSKKASKEDVLTST